MFFYSGTPSSSYRLGNQRRLKYAPPPDLATSNPRVNNFPNLPPQPSFPPAPQAGLFQPPGVVQSVPFGLGFEPSQSSPLSASGSGSGVSSPQNIPSRLSSREVYLEPATPQNTPANQNLLSGFAPAPVVAPDWPPAPKTPRNVEEDVLREVNLRETPPVAEGSSLVSEKESPGQSSSPFAPISAARVSEKLEHLLATRKEEDSPIQNSAIDDVKSISAVSNNDQTEKTTPARYFSPSLDQPQLPSFYDPTKFQGQINPVGVSQPQTTSSPFEQKAPPTLYNPTEYSGVQTQSYRSLTVGNFDPVASNNPQNYFYSNNAGISLQSGNTLAEDPGSYFKPPSPPMAAVVPEPTGSATLDPIQMSINPLGNSGYSNTVDNGLNNIPPSLHNLVSDYHTENRFVQRGAVHTASRGEELYIHLSNADCNQSTCNFFNRLISEV